MPRKTIRRSVIAIAASFALVLCAGAASAQTPGINGVPTDPSSIHLEVPIPQSALEKTVSGAAANAVSGLAEYISRIYGFVIATIGTVAAVMMIVGGFEYLTSAGESGKISAAKKRITDALVGLALALGSYAILNTLNPELLNLRPLSVSQNAVKTDVRTLSWCEDLIAKGVAVTDLMTTTSCGSVGSYKNGQSELACIYHGQCAPTKDPKYERRGAGYFDGVWSTCLQTVGRTGPKGYATLDSATILAEARQQKDQVAFGSCTTCAEINKKTASKLGYATLGAACRTWNDTINAQFRQKFGDGSQFWAYCAEAGDNIDVQTDPQSCLQFDIDCQAADNNSDISVSSQCTDDSNSCGCEGYDDSPRPSYAMSVDPATGNVTRIGTYANTPDDTSAYHLNQLCDANPCKAYVNTVNNKRNFSKGCTFDGSITRHLTTAVNINCRNVGGAVLRPGDAPAPGTGGLPALGT